MAKIELKGKIMEVRAVEAVGENKTPKQTIILMIPAYIDGFGDVKGIEEFWAIDLIGDRVKEINIDERAERKKTICTVFINSKMVKSKTPGNADMYIINAVLKEIILID